MNHILIIEDDIALSNGIVLALKEPNNVFTQTHDIATAKEQLNVTAFDLVILDVNLPDGSGLDLLTHIRKTKALPVIVLTANDMETDVVTGFELGADDYITKPFSLMVLRARVGVQLKKSRYSLADSIHLDNFSFSFERMEFIKNGTPIELSKTEQKLLRILINNRGNTVSRDHLIDSIWTDGAEYVGENALSVTVKRLRDKLEDFPSSPRYIKTVYGIGYTWAVR
ncbi:response regulator transcription factor [Paenibacillus polymyxa]|uniref:response regulator transcription factor n=1 Tax=Paenibacillus polymyxa TaxID=1406 RepID=UPI00234A719F|nr:response regulator transcription factor [Paenibacillus polymyxa]WCM64027.1 response regulator transcription factor [Paenibacillus polymyxa]